MRPLVLFFTLFLVLPAFAQSKKELQAEVDRLRSEVNALNAQITELKRPVEVNLNDSLVQASYSFGVVLGQNFKDSGLDSLNMEVFLVAMQDVLSNRSLKVKRKEAEATMHRFLQAAMMKRSAVAKERSQKFLDENKTKPGVNTTASGLQYEVVSEGSGKAPTTADRVTVHYTGKLTDGTVFDSSLMLSGALSLSSMASRNSLATCRGNLNLFCTYDVRCPLSRGE